MSTNGVNLVCCHGSDGGDLSIDDGGEFWDKFVYENEGDISWAEQTLEDGIAECDKYFEDTHDQSDEEDKKEWQELKEQFRQQVAGLTGKFYVWGVEYDCDLMFLPEDQVDVWKEYQPEDEDEDDE